MCSVKDWRLIEVQESDTINKNDTINKSAGSMHGIPE